MELVENRTATARERFADAVAACGPAMFRAARAVLPGDADAEDAVGEAVLRAWRAWGTLRTTGAERAWLVKIAVNCAYEQYRKNGRVTPTDDLEALAGPAREAPAEGLWDAVGRLERDQRIVVTLFYYEDMPLAEIARLLNVPQGTVKSRLSRARGKLRELLREEDGE